MKCIRIRPEICAKTTCLFSSSTLNIALGKGSTTVPSTAIVSSFSIISKNAALGLLVKLTEDKATPFSYRNGVLKMS